MCLKQSCYKFSFCTVRFQLGFFPFYNRNNINFKLFSTRSIFQLGKRHGLEFLRFLHKQQVKHFLNLIPATIRSILYQRSFWDTVLSYQVNKIKHKYLLDILSTRLKDFILVLYRFPFSVTRPLFQAPKKWRENLTWCLTFTCWRPIALSPASTEWSVEQKKSSPTSSISWNIRDVLL